MSTNMESVFRIGKQASVLPAGYTQLEYIESTGTQWIDTGITVLDTDEIITRASVTGAIGSFVFSQGRYQDNQAFQVSCSSATTNAQFDIQTYTDSYRVSSNLTIKNTFRDIHIKNKEFFVDGVSFGKSIGTLTNPTENLKLFYKRSTNEAQAAQIGIFEVVGKIKLVPAKRNSDNVIGMYDLVSNTFLTNQGTGSFTAGPVVEVTKISQNNQTIWERAVSLESDKDSEVTFRSTRNESKNLFDISKSRIASSDVGTLQPDNSYLISNAGKIGIWSPNYKVVFNGKENTQYTLSAYIKSDSAVKKNITLGFYYSDGTIQPGSPRGSFTEYTKVTCTSTADKTVIGFGAYYDTNENIYIKDCQIEEGSTATSYQPYWNTLPELDAYGNTAQPSAIKPYVKTAISTTPTTFNSELAGPLNVLADGKTEQRNLPAEYQELEYISSDSKAYIDTGIAGGKTTLEIGVKFSYSSFVAYGAIYGNYVSDSHQGVRCILAASSNTIITNNETICTTSGNTELSCSINNVHNIISKNTEVTLDGVTTTITHTTQGNTNTGNIAVLNRSITNPNTSRNIDAKVYEFYIKDNGILVCNLIPAKRLSDSIVGMYDTVSGQFFTNAGTGTFTAGPVKTPGPNNPMDIVSNNGIIKWDGTKIVTEGIQEKITITGPNGEEQIILVPMLNRVGDYKDYIVYDD